MNSAIIVEDNCVLDKNEVIVLEDVLNQKIGFNELVIKVQKLEERLNLLMALRQNKLDLSKFIFQLEPL